jgi:hypothetical protein
MRLGFLAVLWVILQSASALRGDERCGVSFQLPPKWQVRNIEKSEWPGCTIGLQPPGWQERRNVSEVRIPENAMTLTVSRGAAAEDLVNDAGFFRRDGEWFVEGKGTAKAASLHGKTWTGASGEAVVWVGFKDPQRGGHTSRSEFRALLIERARHGRTAVIFCNAGFDCETILPRFVKSVEFVGRH